MTPSLSDLCRASWTKSRTGQLAEAGAELADSPYSTADLVRGLDAEADAREAGAETLLAELVAALVERREAATVRRIAAFQLLSEAGIEAASTVSLGALLQRTLEFATSLTGARYGVLEVLGLDGALKEVFTTGGDTEARAALRALPSEAGPDRALLRVPVATRDQLLGRLYLIDRRGSPAFSEDDRKLGEAFARQAAAVLANLALYRRSEERAEKLTALSTLTRLITSAADSGKVFDAVAEAATTLLQAAITRVWVADAATRTLTVQGRFSVDSRLADHWEEPTPIAFGSGVVGRLVMSETPEYIIDTRQDPRWLNQRLSRQTELHAFAGLPLIAEGRAVGVLSILFRPRGEFTPEEKELMNLLAGQAAIAIKKAQLFEAFRVANRALRVLSECNQALVHATEESEFLHQICRIIVDGGGYRMGWIAFAEHDERKSVRPAAQAGFEEGYLEKANITWSDTERGRGPTGTAIRTGAPVINRLFDPSFAPWREEALKRGYAANIALPLIADGKTFGVLGIYAAEPNAFDPPEVSLLMDLAHDVAYGITALRLRAERARAEEALRERDEQLRQAQKMEAIGRLAGGVAHDFNNLLTVITGRAAHLQEILPPEDPRRYAIDLISKTADRATTLTRQLLAFGRKQILQPRVLDVNAAVTNMTTMLRRLIGEHIELVTELTPTPGRVKADPGQIEQVIMNLVVNARDAMPRGGRLTLETATVELEESAIHPHSGVPAGAYVVIAVSDTGVGMDASTQARVFEPFFTTKEQGKGTGLGLATAYGIVQQSGGQISFSSAPGRGTTFRIYLPRVDEAIDAEPSGEPRNGSPRGSETVLLVEDDEEVRTLAREILAGSGYTVLVARDTDDAVAIAAGHGGPIHLLLTDVVMPKLSGLALAERLRPLRPTMRVLYMSGYADDAIAHHGAVDPGTPFLAKPFKPDRLRRTVRTVLDA